VGGTTIEVVVALPFQPDGHTRGRPGAEGLAGGAAGLVGPIISLTVRKPSRTMSWRISSATKNRLNVQARTGRPTWVACVLVESRPAGACAVNALRLILVYRVRHRDGPVVIYVLFEHKSSPEHWTALQLLRYLVAEGDAYRKQHPKARLLPPVYPLVIYHGKRRWRALGNFQDLIAPFPAVLAPYVPRFTYALHDSSAHTNVEVQGEVLTRLVQLAMRWIFSKEPLGRLNDLLTLIEQAQDRTTVLEILESLLRYYVPGTGRVEERDVCTLLENTSTGDPIMQTFIDRYIEQGRQQGIDQGVTRVRQEGEAAILLRLIDRKFGAPSESVRARITSADPETLLRWCDRILTADSLDAVLNGVVQATCYVTSVLLLQASRVFQDAGFYSSPAPFPTFPTIGDHRATAHRAPGSGL
jgi:hypothetical protein